MSWQEFGINTKKKMTPAKLSKKYELNDYYAHLESPFADKIQAVTSELMLKKNMMNLTKVAFGQESKKKFEDGVPLATHPYLVQQGIDPLEFTAQNGSYNKRRSTNEINGFITTRATRANDDASTNEWHK